MQLIEVLGAPGPGGVKVVVSDGHTQLKARLSSSVIDLLEAELDEKLGTDTTNDVFRLRRFVIVATAIGSEDEWIQLTIDEIEYLYHRRRLIGQPTPIEQDCNIRPLITNRVTSLIDYIPEADNGKHYLQSQESPSDAEAASIAVQRSSPPTLPISRPLESALGKAADALKKKPQLEHTLESDGFEVQAGVNLQRPVQASRTGVDLLHLLTKSKPQREVVAETPIKSANHAGNIRGRGLFAGAIKNGLQSAEESPERSEARRDSAPQNGPSQPSPQQSTTLAVELPRTDAPRLPPVRPRAPQLNTEQSSSPRLTTLTVAANSVVPSQTKRIRPTRANPRIPYERRKIPANQQALLNLETSWLPPLPGHSFPKPNVPIELLKKWNAAPLPSQKPTTASDLVRSPSSQDIQSSRVSQRKAQSPEAYQILSKSPSGKSDESDEMVSSSAWPASQSPFRSRPQDRPAIPPDSPIGPVIRGTPGELEVEPPRALRGQTIAQEALIRPRTPERHLSNEKYGRGFMQRAFIQQQSTQRHPLPDRPAVSIPEANHEMLRQAQYPSMDRSPQVRPQPQPVLRAEQRIPTLPSYKGVQKVLVIPTVPRHSETPNIRHTTVTPTAGHPGSSNQPLGGFPGPQNGTKRASVSVYGNDAPRSSHGARSPPLPPRDSIRQKKTEWREEYRKQEER